MLLVSQMRPRLAHDSRGSSQRLLVVGSPGTQPGTCSKPGKRVRLVPCACNHAHVQGMYQCMHLCTSNVLAPMATLCCAALTFFMMRASSSCFFRMCSKYLHRAHAAPAQLKVVCISHKSQVHATHRGVRCEQRHTRGKAYIWGAQKSHRRSHSACSTGFTILRTAWISSAVKLQSMGMHSVVRCRNLKTLPTDVPATIPCSPMQILIVVPILLPHAWQHA